MAFALGPEARAGGYRLAAYETIGSTSTEALERARAGDPGRLWVVSREQIAGHGRRGRKWETPAGNLAASLLLPGQGSPATAAKLGFVAGLALERAVRAVAEGSAIRAAPDAADGEAALIRLKWPNDVLLDGAKIAGILLQAVALGGGAQGVVIGFGVNVLYAPDGLPFPATSLAASNAAVSADAMFAALAESWTAMAAIWDEGRGFGAIRRLWLDRAAGLGGSIAVHTGEQVLRGIFETIDDDGMLVIRDPSGHLSRIAAGDVHFGVAATAGH